MDTTPHDSPDESPDATSPSTSGAALAAAPTGPAVALPPPTPRATAAPRNNARTVAVIGLVVGVVAGAGAIAGLLNVSRNQGSDDPPELQISQPAPTAPAVPGAGPVAVPITLPGPAVQPAVTAPPVTAPPITGPSDTGPSGTGPSVSTPATTTGGGIQPPAATTPASTAAPAPSSGSVQMTGGVGFDVPAGWDVLDEGEAYAAIATSTAAIYVNIYPSAESASDVLFSYQSVLEGAVAGVEVTDVATAEVYSPLVVDAAAFSYRGFIGQGQSGSTAVAGTVFGDLRVDGVGIVTDVMYVPGADGSISDSDRAAISAFFSSFRYGE